MRKSPSEEEIVRQVVHFPINGRLHCTIPTKHTPVTVILMMRNEDDNEDQDQNQDFNDDNHLKAACHELLSCEDAILVCIQSGVK